MTTDLERFDQGWLAAMEQTPLVRTIIGLAGLTRLGERPAALDRVPLEKPSLHVKRRSGTG
jgi:hypothetical protein